jgi:hypothetical protein
MNIRRQLILDKHLNGVDYNNGHELNEAVIAAMEEYLQEQLKNLNIPVVSESTSPTEKEVIDIILEEVWIRGVDLDDYRNYFEEPRASIKRRLDELYSR